MQFANFVRGLPPNLRLKLAPGKRIIVFGDCLFSGKYYRVTVDLEPFERWQSGEKIQDAFPDLSVDDREWLVSGVHPDEYDRVAKRDRE